jgi:hypothetical protein
LAASALLAIPLPSASHVGLRREEDAPDEELVKKIRLTSGGVCRSIERERAGGTARSRCFFLF